MGNLITEWSGLEGPSGDPPAQPPAQAGSPRAGCTALRPAGVAISPEKETPQPLWAAWARAPSPSEGRSSSSSSAGASSASVCARCPLSCHWAPLKRWGKLILGNIKKKKGGGRESTLGSRQGREALDEHPLRCVGQTPDEHIACRSRGLPCTFLG